MSPRGNPSSLVNVRQFAPGNRVGPGRWPAGAASVPMPTSVRDNPINNRFYHRFHACRAMTYWTLGRHEDKNGRGEPCTSFRVTEPLNLSHLQYAFSTVHQPGLERALTPHEEPSFEERSEEMPTTDLEGPSPRRWGVNLQERSQHAPPHPSPVDLEAHLPRRNGATCHGQRGGVIGMHEDDLQDANKAEVFRLIMDILERKVLHNRTAPYVTGELRN